MKYQRMRLSAYNETPGEPDSFHCDLDLQGNEYTFDALLEKYIKPATNVVFHKMIPEMPDPVKNGGMNPAFIEWETRYFGGPDA